MPKWTSTCGRLVRLSDYVETQLQHPISNETLTDPVLKMSTLPSTMAIFYHSIDQVHFYRYLVCLVESDSVW